MKHILSVLIIIALIVVADSAAQNTGAVKNIGTVEFQRYDSYFEKNNSALQGNTSYLVFARQEQFDKVFGAVPMGESNSVLPSDVFKSRIVVAAIKRGNLRHYADVKVTAQKGRLFVWYAVKEDAPNSATYSTPLILAVDKGKYKEVVFMENGKKAGAAKIKKG
jgi:hypothetical protein